MAANKAKLSLNQKFRISSYLVLGLIITLATISTTIYLSIKNASKQFTQQITDIGNQAILRQYIKDYLHNKIDFFTLNQKVDDSKKFYDLSTYTPILEQLKELDSIRQKNSKEKQELNKLLDESLLLSKNIMRKVIEGQNTPKELLKFSHKNWEVSSKLKLYLAVIEQDTTYADSIKNLVYQSGMNLVSHKKILKQPQYAKIFNQAKSINYQLKDLSDKFIQSTVLHFQKAENIEEQLDTKAQEIQQQRLEYIRSRTQAFRKKLIFLLIFIFAILYTILGFNISIAKILKTFVEDLQSTIQKLANGDLTTQSHLKYTDRQDEIGEISRNFDKTQKSLALLVNEIKSNTEQLSQASQMLSAISQQIATHAQQQAATAEELTASIEEFQTTVISNTENAEKTSLIAQKAAKITEQSSKIFFETIKAVKDITEKITFIAEVAEKTDLLSINAAIEAARAGDSGKGFAVVAHEIRKLAESTQKYSVEIKKHSENGRKLSELAKKKMEQITPEIVKSADYVSDIANANKEQLSAIETINTAVIQLSQIASKNSQLADSMSTSAEELQAQAQTLSDLVSRFRTNEH